MHQLYFGFDFTTLFPRQRLGKSLVKEGRSRPARKPVLMVQRRQQATPLLLGSAEHARLKAAAFLLVHGTLPGRATKRTVDAEEDTQ